jgi:alternate signal-mediated exported protein
MNRLTKGLIAGGAGLVLLIGSAGTLALWNDAATLNAGSVDSGVLTVDATGGAWDNSITAWSPGDTATYTANVSIVAQGDNLHSQLSIDPSSITGDPALLAALQITMTVGTTSGGTLTPVAGQPNTFDVVSAAPTTTAPITAPVTVTVTFPPDSVTGTEAQAESVQLSGLQFLLQQTP